MATCEVCLERENQGPGTLCALCMRSLDRVGSTHYDVIRWAARRARRFQSARTRRTRRNIEKRARNRGLSIKSTT